MGKIYKNFYPQIHDLFNLWQAFIKASKGRRSHPSIAAFEYDLEPELIQLRDELRDESYQPGGYRSFTVHEPKRRKISAAPFRDRVVHHALMNVIGPMLERKFIHDSYANQIGKGTHKALDRCTYLMRRYAYVLPCDVKQFFPSIDHEILKSVLSKTIQDASAMKLVEKIAASGEGILNDEYDMTYFTGDDPSTGSGQGLFAANRPRGLPIGNLTSQFWANVYLNELDQFVKQKLKVRAYIRYVDDFVLFSNDKRELHEWRSAIIDFLASLRLTIHEESAHARPTWKGITFLGFIVFPEHRRLKPSKGYAFGRRWRHLYFMRQAGTMTPEKLKVHAVAWANHAQYGDTWNLRRKILNSVNS
ncbi:MAG: group II intron reverse transcriptase domain-containing protein [Anaerolineales bacterium]|nr:group II intron reverse transcriptase domain-containing protein [Anaerolineales bacterium]